MGFSFSKLFKNDKAEATTNDSIEAIIADVEHQPFGVSDSNVLFAGLNELGGYFFFQTVLVGALQIKSKNGAALTFKGEEFELKLNADSQEFESDHSDVKGRFITKIDFEIEEAEIENLQNAELTSIIFNAKNKTLEFTKFENNNDEEE
ncbi:hypothetical protein [Winogradskyella sp.]|uniref:hypothetical protein n=1 Tax=Winogradskyella sp. TaxID=1883156 RepID=UPI003F6BB81D